jgi:DNA-binding phage protein
MTTDEAIREAKNRWARRRRRLIGYGQWQPFTDATPAREHVLAIKAAGMGLANIAARTGVNRGSLDHLLYGSPPIPPAAQIRTENAQALLAYWPTLDDYEDHNIIDGTGTRRRMQALAMAGWPSRAVHQRIGIAHAQTFERLYHCEKVTARLARAVRDFYNEFSAKKPEEHGVEAWIAKRARGNATKKNWSPAIVWDDDSIDDPASVPDWTGVCGTDRGYWVHKRQRLPMCARCEQAHVEWLAEHAHLTPQELNREQFRARAAAASREADLAADARELMRFYVGLDQAAERLGVTKQHLQQALIRHPDLERAA